MYVLNLHDIQQQQTSIQKNSCIQNFNHILVMKNISKNTERLKANDQNLE